MKNNRGYSLVEIIGVVILLVILMGVGIWSIGNNKDKATFGKITQDLARITSAKVSWRTDHPQDAYPTDEPTRFTVLQPYLKAGLLSVPSLNAWEPPNVLYSINDEQVLPTALNNQTGKLFDPSVNGWSN